MTSARGAQPGGMTWEAEEGRRKGELRPWRRGSLMNVQEPLGSLIQGSRAGGFSCGCLNSSCRGPWREGAAYKSQHCSREGSRGLHWTEWEGGCFTQLGSLSCRAYLLRTNQAVEAGVGVGGECGAGGASSRPPPLTSRGMGSWILSQPRPVSMNEQSHRM